LSFNLEQEIDELRHEINNIRVSLQEKLLNHLEYHQNNEAKWGIVKIMRDHPFKTFLAGITIGGLLFGLMNANNIITFFARIMR